MIVCCKQHMEFAIHDFVDEYEEAPDFINCRSNIYSLDHPAVVYCEGEPNYLVV